MLLPAFYLKGNIMPVPQMLARPGIVQTDIALVVADETIATFSVKFYVN